MRHTYLLPGSRETTQISFFFQYGCRAPHGENVIGHANMQALLVFLSRDSAYLTGSILSRLRAVQLKSDKRCFLSFSHTNMLFMYVIAAVALIPVLVVALCAVFATVVPTTADPNAAVHFPIQGELVA